MSADDGRIALTFRWTTGAEIQIVLTRRQSRELWAELTQHGAPDGTPRVHYAMLGQPPSEAPRLRWRRYHAGSYAADRPDDGSTYELWRAQAVGSPHPWRLDHVADELACTGREAQTVGRYATMREGRAAAEAHAREATP